MVGFTVPEQNEYATYFLSDERKSRTIIPLLEAAGWPCDRESLAAIGIRDDGKRYVQLSTLKGAFEFIEDDNGGFVVAVYTRYMGGPQLFGDELPEALRHPNLAYSDFLSAVPALS